MNIHIGVNFSEAGSSEDLSQLTITIELPAGILKLAKAEAERKAIALQDYLAEIIAQAVISSEVESNVARSLLLLDSIDQVGSAPFRRDRACLPVRPCRAALDGKPDEARRLPRIGFTTRSAKS